MQQLCQMQGMTPQQLAIQEAKKRGIDINALYQQAQNMLNGR